MFFELELPTKTDDEKKQYFLKHILKHKINKEAYMDSFKSKEKKVGFAAVFLNIGRRGALP